MLTAKSAPARVQISDVTPQIDCGRYPAKATLGDRVTIRATIFRDGHDVLSAVVRYRAPGARRFAERGRVQVRDVRVGAAEVDFDPQVVPRERIAAAIEDEGYRVRSLEG